MIHSSPVRKKKSLIWILNFVCVFVSVSTILFAEEKKIPTNFSDAGKVCLLRLLVCFVSDENTNPNVFGIGIPANVVMSTSLFTIAGGNCLTNVHYWKSVHAALFFRKWKRFDPCGSHIQLW
jgi:hypothetical protein